MNNISVSSDIVPIGQFKAKLSKYLKEMQANRNSLIITQNGKPAGVLVSPQEFDELQGLKSFISSISRGLSDSEKGNVFTSKQLKEQLRKSRTKKPA
jgi:prevent-host-death family protein